MVQTLEIQERAKNPGRPPVITLKVVKRVAKKVAQGVPLRYALAAENNRQINLDSWHKAIQRNDDFRAEYERAHGAFVQAACQRLVKDRDPVNLKWILERRYPADFARKPDTEVNVTQTVACQLHEKDLALEIARAFARPGEPLDFSGRLDIEVARVVAQHRLDGIEIEALSLSDEAKEALSQAQQWYNKRIQQENEERARLAEQKTASFPV